MEIMERQSAGSNGNTHPASESSLIAILGHHRLQNDLLAELIRSETSNTSVSVVSQSDEIHRTILNAAEDNKSLLIVIDYRGVEFEETLEVLRKHTTTPDQFQVALFNLPESTDLEEFASWPQLSGAFLSNIDQSQLIKGINAILDGEIWLPRKLVSKFVHRARSSFKPTDTNAEKLTEREIEILKVMSTGARNVEIADSLNLSPHTVKTHVYNIFKKINASNRLQAVNWANDHIST